MMRHESFNKNELKQCRSIIGQLGWAAGQSMPDIAFDCCEFNSSVKHATIENLLRAKFLNEIFISAIKFFKTLQATMLYSHMTKVDHPGIMHKLFYELRNVYTIRRAKWYVAGKEWKIDNVEVKIITFVKA